MKEDCHNKLVISGPFAAGPQRNLSIFTKLRAHLVWYGVSTILVLSSSSLERKIIEIISFLLRTRGILLGPVHTGVMQDKCDDCANLASPLKVRPSALSPAAPGLVNASKWAIVRWPRKERLLHLRLADVRLLARDPRTGANGQFTNRGTNMATIHPGVQQA